MDQGLIWGSSRGEERRGKQRERRRKEHTPLENPKTMFSYLFNVTFSFLLKTLPALCLCHFLKLTSAHTIKHRHMHIFIKERSLYRNAILSDFFSCLLCLLWAVVTHSWQEFPTCRHTEYLTVFSYFWI